MPIGIGTLPNQKHKIIAREEAVLNMLVVGQKGLGKKTLVNFLFQADIIPPASTANNATYSSLLIEKGVAMRLNLKLVDFEADVVSPSLEHVPRFIDECFQSFLDLEAKAARQDIMD